ncbi:MAG: hypothetical protein JSW39_18085 [Desulfobacterales bacterium]|nr:MAG: hypothetical protein JSW39_18085 [Desulfobacterales bacterium]
MKFRREKPLDTDSAVPRTPTSELRGRQSVRATFKLSAECIDAISILATHLGIKQKSLFDYLMEDIQSLSAIAREIEHADLKRAVRVQKTFVVSRRSLHALEQISSDFDASRDALVEYSVQRLLPIIAKERQKHEARKTLLGKISKHYKAGQTILNEIRADLGQEDPMHDRFEAVMAAYQNVLQTMEAFIEKAKIIEDFQADQTLAGIASLED